MDTLNTAYNANSGFRELAYLNNEEYGDASKYNTINISLLDMQTEYKNMIAKVAKYNGFYIGRYETSLSDAGVDSVGTNGTVQSKPGVIPTSESNSATSSWYGLDSINNIRDLGGNLRELTLEACVDYSRVFRGGYYNNSSSPSYRHDNYPFRTFEYNGSRLALYIK